MCLSLWPQCHAQGTAVDAVEEGSALTEKWEAEMGAAEYTAAGLIPGYQGQHPPCSQTHCLQHFSEPSILPLLVFSVMPLQ